MSEQVITHADQISVTWLDEVLRESGDLVGGSVAGFAVEPLHSDNSHVIRIRLDYAPGSAGNLPATLFLKMCGGDNSHPFGPSEVEYYRRDYVGRPNLPLLKCYSAVYSPEQKSYHLLLEDLTQTHGPCWEKRADGEYIYPVAEGLGALHACHWATADSRPASLGWPLDDQLGRYFDHILPGVPLLLAELKDAVDPALLELAKTLADRLPAKLYQRAQNSNGLTLVHGDPNPGNILAPLAGPTAGKTYLIDRQPFDWSLTTWLGVSDLAYAVALWWEPELRRQHEVKILATYYASLRENGVSGYTWEQLWLDYRLAVMQCIFIPFEWALLESDRRNMRWVWEPEFRRILAATQDLNGLALLD